MFLHLSDLFHDLIPDLGIGPIEAPPGFPEHTPSNRRFATEVRYRGPRVFGAPLDQDVHLIGDAEVDAAMSAVVARGMFQDAVDAGLIETNPFSRLNIAEKPGRRDHAPLTLDELHGLADLALAVHGPEYGPVMRSMILFTAYSGARQQEGSALEWSWVDFARSEVAFKVAKFDKPRTVLLLDEAAEALRSMPRHADEHQQVFRTKRGLPIRGKSAHHFLWRPVQLAFWAGLSQRRQADIVDLDWHSLRHFCGWYFYVHLGLSDELTAYQLGHSDAKLVRGLYGHGQADALERLKQQSRVQIRPIRATSLPHAVSESA